MSLSTPEPLSTTSAPRGTEATKRRANAEQEEARENRAKYAHSLLARLRWRYLLSLLFLAMFRTLLVFGAVLAARLPVSLLIGYLLLEVAIVALKWERYGRTGRD